MDDIFCRINNCQSAAGDIDLYIALRSPLLPGDDLRQREETAQFFAGNTPLMQQTQLRLAQLGRKSAIGMDFAAFHAKYLALPGRRVYQLLAFLPLVGLALMPFWLNAGIIVLVLSLLSNLILTFRTRTKYEKNFLAVRYLAACIVTAKKLATLLRPHNPALAEMLRQAAAPFGSFTRSYTLLSFNDMITQAGLLDPTSFLLLPVLSYGKMGAGLQGMSAQIMQLYSALGHVDAAICVLSYRESLEEYTLPVFRPQSGIEATQLVHPLLDEPVGNNAGFAQNVLLTGSNASGKSTFIKAVAINCILAQTINTCTAQAFALKRGFVATSMAVEDSVIDGDSYFIAEIKSMRRLMQLLQSQSNSYFFIDEILKGTNTIERVAASAAVLRHLSNPRCLCFAATHDIELTGMLKTLYSNYHFTETITAKGDVVFSYRLQKGPATSRNAILLLENMAFPPDVTALAHGLVETFEAQGEWRRLDGTK